MAAGNKLEHRAMGDKPIAHTFRGILRVAGVQEIIPDVEDVYFDSRYYGKLEGGIASQDFYYDSAFLGISGSLARYASEDPYKSNKVPVTDSLGYYLNINLGSESTTIGSDLSNNGNSADKTTFVQTLSPTSVSQEVVFPVFETKELLVGFEPIKATEYKSKIIKGTLSLDYSDSVPCLITYNNYDHSPANIQNGTYKKVTSIKNRTIIRDSKDSPQDFDVLMHRQDNIDYHNLSNQTLDAFVEPTNIKDYIKDKLDIFMEENIDEVLTGTLVQQYVDLNKWYCSSDSATNYAGHQPPMNLPDYNGELKPSIYQGVSIGSNRTFTNVSVSDGGSWTYEQLDEIIPFYKRDYLLCDGSTYYIYLSTVNNVNNIDYVSFDRFFNLFFCIEYKYTDRDKIKKHYINEPVALSDGTKKYKYTLTDNKKTENKTEIDKEVLFGIDVMSALAFKTIWENMLYGTENKGTSSCLNATTHKYDRSLAETWLKKQKIPEQYIFNTPIPSASGGISYKYVTAPQKQGAAGKEIPIELGKEVNSFASELWYYSCSDKKYIAVPAWKTAEVQAVLDLFTSFGIAREKDLKENYVFSFQVPDFRIDAEKYSVGAMIGSSPYYWSNDAKGETKTASVCLFDEGMIPHRHYIFEGAASNHKETTATEKVTSTTMARGEGPWKTGVPWVSNIQLNDRLYNYLFCELNNTSYETSFISGLNVHVIQLANTTKLSDPDPRFRDAEPNRGMTSPPIVISTQSSTKNTLASSNSTIGSAEFFSPETIQVMTLIKL